MLISNLDVITKFSKGNNKTWAKNFCKFNPKSCSKQQELAFKTKNFAQTPLKLDPYSRLNLGMFLRIKVNKTTSIKFK